MWGNKYLYTAALVVLCSPAWAGMDFTSLGGNKAMISPEAESDKYYMRFQIPWFENKQQAINWANSLTTELKGWQRAMRRRIRRLGEQAYPESAKLTPEGLKKAGDLMQNAYYYETAINVIEAKRKLGATFYAGSIPL